MNDEVDSGSELKEIDSPPSLPRSLCAHNQLHFHHHGQIKPHHTQYNFGYLYQLMNQTVCAKSLKKCHEVKDELLVGIDSENEESLPCI